MNVLIQRVAPEHVSTDLLRALAPAERWTEHEAGELTRRAIAHSRADDRFIAVASTGSAPVGMVEAQDYGTSLWRGFAVLRMHDLFVVPAHRRHGIGRELVAAALRWARSRPDAGFIEWQAARSAVPFYESLKLTPDYVSDVPEYPYFVLDLRPGATSSRETSSSTPVAALDWL